MVLFVAWIAIIYCILAAVIFLAAGLVVGELPRHGVVGWVCSVVTDSRFILIFSWLVASLSIISLRRE